MKKADIHFVFEELSRRYSGASTELVYSTPFQLLVAVIMSAQTTDKQVNKVTGKFFDSIKSPKDILNIQPEIWELMIQGVNYYKNKAKYIYKLAVILNSSFGAKRSGVEESHKGLVVGQDLSALPQDDERKHQYQKEFIKKRGYWIPNTQVELTKLPGVGEKTAKVILQVLHGHHVIAVDTHVHRVTNRLGIVSTNEPLQTSKILEQLVPIEFRNDAHHGLILFGRYHCIARNPKCETCPFTKICPWYKEYVYNNKKSTKVK